MEIVDLANLQAECEIMTLLAEKILDELALTKAAIDEAMIHADD